MRCTRILAPLLVVLAAQPAFAGDDIEGARALGMGGARASAASEAAVFLNPAGLPLTKAYAVQALFDYRTKDNLTAVGIAITDSVTNRAGVAAGLYYTFINAEPKFSNFSLDGSTISYTRRGHEAGLALAYPLAERFILGVTNKYLYLNSTDQTGNIPGARSRGYTLDTGFVLRISDAINFGAVGQNVVPMKTWETPPTLGLGLSLGLLKAMTLEADVVIRWLDYRDGEKLRMVVGVKAGGEYFVGNRFPLRLGYSWDLPFRELAVRSNAKGESFFHAGLGYMSQSFGIEAAVRQQLSGSDKETLLGFALKLFVQ